MSFTQLELIWGACLTLDRPRPQALRRIVLSGVGGLS